MGQKTHPIGFRLGTTRDWVSHWFGVNPRDYRAQVLEDHNIRDHINSKLGDSSGISHIQIQRNSEDLAINSGKPREFAMLSPTLEAKLSPAKEIKGSSDHTHSKIVV